MALPGATTRTIGDLVPEVIDYLQQRTDVATIAPKYIKRALMEITESEPFEELRVTGPQVALTANLATYPIATFLVGDDDYTSPESFSVFVDFPTNTVVSSIDYKTPKALETMMTAATVGLPSRFTRYGTNFFFGPTPDKGYTVMLRYQKRHPFPLEDSQLKGAPIFIPDSWEEIVAISAALRIAIVKRWNDQKDVLHSMLFGDPEFMVSEGKRGRPGLISARRMQVERDQRFNTRQIMPVVGRYNAR